MAVGNFLGPLVLGRLFDSFGWHACVAGVGVALAAAAMLTFALKR